MGGGGARFAGWTGGRVGGGAGGSLPSLRSPPYPTSPPLTLTNSLRLIAPDPSSSRSAKMNLRSVLERVGGGARVWFAATDRDQECSPSRLPPPTPSSALVCTVFSPSHLTQSSHTALSHNPLTQPSHTVCSPTLESGSFKVLTSPFLSSCRSTSPEVGEGMGVRKYGSTGVWEYGSTGVREYGSMSGVREVDRTRAILIDLSEHVHLPKSVVWGGG